VSERPEQKLSTADMAAAAERQSGQDQPPSPSGTSAPTPDGTQVALFGQDETQHFRDRWDDVQTGFVDEPRRAVEQADELVAEVMKRLAEIFAAERSKLESQWSQGSDVSTEDLRLALRRYRSFFDRLLSYGGQAAEARPAAAGATSAPNQAPRPQADGASQHPETRDMNAAPPRQEAMPSQPGPNAGAQPTARRWDEVMPRYRASWEQHFGSRGDRWEADEPCYRYAWEMQQAPQYHDRPWSAVEPELRQDWERRHPDTPWDRVAAKIRDAWECAAPARAR